MIDFGTPEAAVIGCILIDSRCLPAVREVLPTAEAFSGDHCRRAYEAMLRLEDSHRSVDPVTVGSLTGLERDFLCQCMELAPTCYGAAQYAQAVLEGFQRRKLRALGDWLTTESYAAANDVPQLLANARNALEQLTDTALPGAAQSPGASLHAFMRYREEIEKGRRQTVKTGFSSLDALLGGLAPGGLYILAARPGVGKSALGIALADMLAKDTQVLYASLEMTAEELNARRVAAVSPAPCSFGKLLFEKLPDEDDEIVANACAALSERGLHILAASSLSVPGLEIQARNVKASVVFVDYLGLLSATDRKASEYDRITQISGDLKKMAKRLNCVVVALCQLNRESVTGGAAESRPKLSQLRSSGAIEQDADGVLLLHRPSYGQPEEAESQSAPQQFFVDVAKNRHGRTGRIELTWYAAVNRFEAKGKRWTEKSWS